MSELKLPPETIYLVPGDYEGEHGYLWCEDPAPGIGMDEAEAIKYTRAQPEIILEEYDTGFLPDNPDQDFVRYILGCAFYFYTQQVNSQQSPTEPKQ